MENKEYFKPISYRLEQPIPEIWLVLVLNNHNMESQLDSDGFFGLEAAMLAIFEYAKKWGDTKIILEVPK